MDWTKRIQERVSGYMPGHIGMTLVSVTPDEVVGTLEVRKELCNTAGVLHGGALMAFADTLGGVGAFVNLPEGKATTTVESKTNFTAPVFLGGKVTGRSTPVHKGKTLSVWQTEVRDEDGKLIGLVTQSQMVISRDNFPNYHPD